MATPDHDLGVAPERELLVGFLQNMRAAVIATLDGIADPISRMHHVPSVTNLLGIVHHLAWVEVWWFPHVFAGEEIDSWPWSDDDPDGEFTVADDVSADEVIALYRANAERSDAIIAAHDLDDVAAGLLKPDGTRGRQPSLRWIVVHMIEETARHAGHNDILRELTDGVSTYS